MYLLDQVRGLEGQDKLLEVLRLLDLLVEKLILLRDVPLAGLDLFFEVSALLAHQGLLGESQVVVLLVYGLGHFEGELDVLDELRLLVDVGDAAGEDRHQVVLEDVQEEAEDVLLGEVVVFVMHQALVDVKQLLEPVVADEVRAPMMVGLVRVTGTRL